jgi:two-component system, OmpR family, response regulator
VSAAPRILVVEDDFEARAAMVSTLREAGYDVVEAAEGREALKHAVSVKPDLVLLDLILPDSAGFELLGQLRALPGGAEFPVVAVSGFFARADDAMAEEEKFSAYLYKPFKSARLLELVATELARRPSGK